MESPADEEASDGGLTRAARGLVKLFKHSPHPSLSTKLENFAAIDTFKQQAVLEQYRKDIADQKEKLRDEVHQMEIEHAKHQAMSNLLQGSIGKELVSVMPPEYVLRIRPATNGGFAVWFEHDMYIARDADELHKVFITAVAKLKIKG
jgi:hypothetical protein